jgi:hypothetical protein
LVGKSFAYLVWGINDESHKIIGTTFSPASTKVGNEELENWLLRLLTPKIHFRFFEIVIENSRMEGVYDDMVNDTGFLCFAPVHAARGQRFSARSRAQQLGQPTTPAPISEEELYS